QRPHEPAAGNLAFFRLRAGERLADRRPARADRPFQVRTKFREGWANFVGEFARLARDRHARDGIDALDALERTVSRNELRCAKLVRAEPAVVSEVHQAYAAHDNREDRDAGSQGWCEGEQAFPRDPGL